GGQSAAARPLKDGALVRVHLGSGNFPALVVFQESGQLEPGQSLMAQIRLESRVFAFHGDRFIVRDAAEQATLAGGMVLDPDASRRGFHSPARRQFLREIGSAEIGQRQSVDVCRDRETSGPLTRPSGTLSPSGGEGLGEGAPSATLAPSGAEGWG